MQRRSHLEAVVHVLGARVQGVRGCHTRFAAIIEDHTMRLTTSHHKRPQRRAIPAPAPRRGWLHSVAGLIAVVSGRRRRDAELAREQFEQLDVDQRVRHIGEW
jgi:hypothetical protein